MSFASCCVLSFNRPQFLRACISTLLGNANAPLELIIHDDGSSDDEVYELLYGWQREGITSTLITNPPGHNEGQGVALNRMFHMAKGDPIIKIDQDVVFKQNWLAQVQDLLGRNGDVGEEPRIGLLGLTKYAHDPVDYRKTQLASHDGWEEHTHILGSAFALRRETWEELGPFEEYSEAFAEDWVMQQAVTASADYVCALPPDDLCTNMGMGPPHSTLVLSAPTPDKPAEIQSIHKQPLIHG